MLSLTRTVSSTERGTSAMIVNRFMTEVERADAADAILPFPLQNALTRPARLSGKEPAFVAGEDNTWARCPVAVHERKQSFVLLSYEDRGVLFIWTSYDAPRQRYMQ